MVGTRNVICWRLTKSTHHGGGIRRHLDGPRGMISFDCDCPAGEDHRKCSAVCLLGLFRVPWCKRTSSMDRMMQAPLNIPVSPLGPPDRQPINHPARFRVQINSTEFKRKRYSYSYWMNSIYVRYNSPVTFKFLWNRHVVPSTMFVRASLVFAKNAHAHQRVETCVQHSEAARAAGRSEVVAKNVLRSASTDFNNRFVYYCGDPNNVNSWMSVLVRFNKKSKAACRHTYQFVCRNSCPTGISRRPIGIIFTLEDRNGRVVGRKCVNVCVTTCPRKDKHNDEAKLVEDLLAELAAL